MTILSMNSSTRPTPEGGEPGNGYLGEHRRPSSDPVTGASRRPDRSGPDDLRRGGSGPARRPGRARPRCPGADGRGSRVVERLVADGRRRLRRDHRVRRSRERSIRPRTPAASRRTSWSATPPASDRRSRARSSGRCSSSGRTRWRSVTAAAGRCSSTGSSRSWPRVSIRSCPSRVRSAPRATSPRWPTSRCRSSVVARSSSAAGGCPRSLALARGGSRTADARGEGGPGAPERDPDDGRRSGRSLLADADRLARTASVAAAISVEALLGTDVAFSAAYQLARPHPGQIAVAAELRHLLREFEPPDEPPRARPQGPGSLLAALRAAGPWRGPRRARSSPPRPGHRAEQCDRQPADLPATAASRRPTPSRPAAGA